MSVRIRSLVSGILCLLSYTATADNTVITIVYGDENTPPYEILKEHQAPTGYHIELIQAVANQLGLEVRFVGLPWTRALQRIANGDAEAISFVSKTPKRERYIHFHEDNVLSQSVSHLVVPNTVTDDYNGQIDSLARTKIGVQASYIYGEPFDSHGELNKIAVQTATQLAAMLDKERLDAAIMTRDVFLANQHLPQFEHIHMLSTPVSMVDNYIGFSHHQGKELSQRFAAAMKKYRQSPQFTALRNKYQIPELQPQLVESE